MSVSDTAGELKSSQLGIVIIESTQRVKSLYEAAQGRAVISWQTSDRYSQAFKCHICSIHEYRRCPNFVNYAENSSNLCRSLFTHTRSFSWLFPGRVTRALF